MWGQLGEVVGTEVGVVVVPDCVGGCEARLPVSERVGVDDA